MTSIGTGWRKGVRILCAFALLFVGFAHKPPAPQRTSVQSVELSQYLLPDGTPNILCLSGVADDGKHSGKAFHSGCEACRLSASILLPTPADSIGWLIRFRSARIIPIPVDTFRRLLFLPNAAPRGPPSDVTSGAAVARAAAISVRAG